jgi:putative flippase GtrA
VSGENSSLGSGRARYAKLRHFLHFIMLGGVAAGVNWTSRFAWQWIMPFEWALIPAYCTGMVTAFILFSVYVFPGSSRSYREQILFFVATNAVSASIMAIVTLFLAKILFPALGLTWHAEPIAHALGIASQTIPSFLGHKYVTWRR